MPAVIIPPLSGKQEVCLLSRQALMALQAGEAAQLDIETLLAWHPETQLREI